ncbi:hypothetical protein FRC12_022098 [Ceratobasidium sp. 428]|nr:hypothetical protein FRC12_022098 [Ceratobasidium sp. 428]
MTSFPCRTRRSATSSGPNTSAVRVWFLQSPPIALPSIHIGLDFQTIQDRTSEYREHSRISRRMVMKTVFTLYYNHV